MEKDSSLSIHDLRFTIHGFLKRCVTMNSIKPRAVLVALALVGLAAIFAGGATSGVKTKGRQANEAPALFSKHCATCHGKDGRAKTFKAKFNKARDLTDARWQAEATDERIFNAITQGSGSKMPSFKKKLSEAQVESLVAHVRGLKK
jgi:mono/diheme cytochrome c family protein